TQLAVNPVKDPGKGCRSGRPRAGGDLRLEAAGVCALAEHIPGGFWRNASLLSTFAGRGFTDRLRTRRGVIGNFPVTLVFDDQHGVMTGKQYAYAIFRHLEPARPGEEHGVFAQRQRAPIVDTHLVTSPGEA